KIYPKKFTKTKRKIKNQKKQESDAIKENSILTRKQKNIAKRTKIIYNTKGRRNMAEYLKLTNDIVFQRIFGKVGNENITKAFLEKILGIKIEELTLDTNKRLIG